MMSYHNLHLLRYRRAPESNISKENNESGSDHNHHLANQTNPGKQHMISSSSSSTMILSSIQNKTLQPFPSKQTKNLQIHQERKHSRLWLLTNCCRIKAVQQRDSNDKRSSHTASSKSTAAATATTNNTLVDYCTYHDVAISRVTCV